MTTATDYTALYPPWRDLADSALSLGTATASLPLVTMLGFGYSLMQLLLLPPDTLSNPSLAEGCMVVSLAVAVAVSALTLAYSLLEVYYVNMVTSACRHMQDEQRQQEIMEELDSQLQDFAGLRSVARNGTWLSLLSLMLALAAKLAGSAAGAVPIISVVILSGVFTVLFVVRRFRQAYRPMLLKASFVR